jgi:malonyl CoA-acyl carrier protein transacylase
MQVFVFPGRGSQKRGMGQRLFTEVGEFAAVEDQVDEIVGYSMRRLCPEDAEKRLNETQFTQPSLYAVNALPHNAALAKGERPQFVAGHSLGEYNALLTSSALDFSTGFRIIRKRGELMAQERSGGMALLHECEPARQCGGCGSTLRNRSGRKWNRPQCRTALRVYFLLRVSA